MKNEYLNNAVGKYVVIVFRDDTYAKGFLEKTDHIGDYKLIQRFDRELEFSANTVANMIIYNHIKRQQS